MIESLLTDLQIKGWLQVQVSKQYRGQWAINDVLDPSAADLEATLEDELETLD